MITFDHTEIVNIQSELLNMSYADTRLPSDENRAPFSGTNRARVRGLGERLNQLGGLSLMVSVCESMPKCDQRELECAWDGIGEWLV